MAVLFVQLRHVTGPRGHRISRLNEAMVSLRSASGLLAGLGLNDSPSTPWLQPYSQGLDELA